MLLENEVSGFINEESINLYENQLNLAQNKNIMDTITEIKRTPIQEFFADKNVFITGATGFLGKMLVEKLLRSCPEVSTIYLLIRPKNHNDITDRIENIFNEPIFEQLRKEQPKFRHKIVGICGDCSLSDLGLTVKDRKILAEEVNVVFHSAATVKFNEKLGVATAINAGGTLAMINICKEMKKLKVMMHVSTAYANCHVDTIDEKFYDFPYKYEQLSTIVDSLSDEAISAVLPRILDKWPNTYTYTKALAEQIVKDNCVDMPVGIFRPGIIISCADEPLPGWIDNVYGPTGVAAAATTGIIKYMCVDPSVKANLVPVDYTVCALLACAWEVANKQSKEEISEDISIYNYVSTVENPIKWNDYLTVCLHYAREFPIQKTVWYLTVHISKNKFIKFFAILFLHLLPALLADSMSVLVGQKPQLIKALTKMQKFMNVLEPFCLRNWTFKDENVRQMWSSLDPKDQHIFKFSFKQFDWEHYLRSHIIGIKLYLFKEDMSSLESAKKRLRKLRWIHETVKVIVLGLVILLLWKILSIFF